MISTAKGRHLVACLPALLTDPVTTAEWEQKLDEIATQREQQQVFLAQQTTVLRSLIDELRQKC